MTVEIADKVVKSAVDKMFAKVWDTLKHVEKNNVEDELAKSYIWLAIYEGLKGIL